MGRGLSDLQRHILAEASTRRRLYYVDVLIGYFGWIPTNPIRRFAVTFTSTTTGLTHEAGEIASPGSQFFSSRAIGKATYEKTMAALSRACLLLERRGLVSCVTGYSRWSAVEITDKGREWLSVNKAASVPPC